MKILIGHVGEPLAGKETVSKMLAARAKQDGLSVAWIQFRDPLQETLKILSKVFDRSNLLNPNTSSALEAILREVWDIEITPQNVRKFNRVMAAHFGDNGSITIDRPNLQKLAIVMRPLFGDDALSHAVFSRVKKCPEDIVQADGIRWLSDETELRKVPGACMLYTTARFKIRAARAKIRKKEGEQNKTVRQLRLEEQAENERYIAEIGARADYKIVNESTPDVLKSEIEKFYMKFVHPFVHVTC